MRPDPETFRSAFIQQRAADSRGSFGSYLSGGSSAGGFSSGMQSTLGLPPGANRRNEQAYAQAGEDFTAGLFDTGLKAATDSQDQGLAIGNAGIRGAQGAAHARRMAKLSAQSAQQQSTFSAISSGMSMLGSIGGAFATRPAASSFGGASGTRKMPTAR